MRILMKCPRVCKRGLKGLGFFSLRAVDGESGDNGEQRTKRRTRSKGLGCFGLVGLAGVLYFGRSIRVLLHSLLFLAGVSSLPQQGSLPVLDWLVAYDVDRSSVTAVLDEGEELRLDIYRPEGQGPFPALLMVPGFAKDGIEDDRMIALAKTVARAGVIVVLPDLAGIFHYRLVPKDAERLVTAFETMAALPKTRQSHLGIFGASISGGYALAAATDPRIARRLGFFIAFAPYHSGGPLYQFIATGSYEYRGKQLWKKPNPFARWIFLYNYLYLEVNPSDPEFQILLEVIRLKIYEEWDAAERLSEQLSEVACDKLQKLEGIAPEILGPLAEHAVASYSMAERSVLEPVQRLCDLSGELFIIHGSDDNVIPFTESIALAEQCGQCPKLECDLLITGIYDHADVDAKPRGIWQKLTRGIPEMLRYYKFLYRVLWRILEE